MMPCRVLAVESSPPGNGRLLGDVNRNLRCVVMIPGWRYRVLSLCLHHAEVVGNDFRRRAHAQYACCTSTDSAVTVDNALYSVFGPLKRLNTGNLNRHAVVRCIWGERALATLCAIARQEPGVRASGCYRVLQAVCL